jgi:hypothetical protein
MKRNFKVYKSSVDVLVDTINAEDVKTAAFIAFLRTGFSFVMVYDNVTDLFYHCSVDMNSDVLGPWIVDIYKSSRP